MRAGIALSDDELTAELDAITDTATDSIAERTAAALEVKPWQFINPWSRLVVDPERFPDEREELNAVGRGAVYTRACSGIVLREDDPGRRAALLKEYFDPYAFKLTELVDQRLEATGSAMIIDIHSYPREASAYELRGDALRPEICIGDVMQASSCPASHPDSHHPKRPPSSTTRNTPRRL